MRMRLAGLALLVCALSLPAGATDYLSAIEDVPLPEGLAERGEAVVFESDFGRMIKSEAGGQMGAEAVGAFYVETLPALGWAREGASLDFVRGLERLEIDVTSGKQGVLVGFELIVTVAPGGLG